MPDDTLKDDLKELISEKKIVVVVGSGVSISATNGMAPTWCGLIESAVRKCRSLVTSGPKEKDEIKVWCDTVNNLLKLKQHPEMLLSAAQMVHEKLNRFGDGEFSRWLRESFELLDTTDRTLINAVSSLDAPLLTTNYDDLIETVTGLKYVTWKDASHMSRIVRGEDRRVLHLHGHWDHAETIVLGIRSYEAVKNDDHTQAIMKAFGLTKSFLFIGCGDDGLSDPNFGNFLAWLEQHERSGGVQHRHYRLVRSSDDVKQHGRIFPLVYGDRYEDLPGFLQELIPGLPHHEVRQPGRMIVKTSVTLPDSVSAYLDRLAEDTCRLKLLGDPHTDHHTPAERCGRAV